MSSESIIAGPVPGIIPVIEIPQPVARDSYSAWEYRYRLRHTRMILDSTICEDLCRCKTCPLLDGKGNDPRTCPEYYRITEIIRDIVRDRDITEETI